MLTKLAGAAIPGKVWLLGGLLLAAFAAGAWFGWDYRDARAERDRVDQAMQSIEDMETIIKDREVARLAAAKVAARTQTALQEALNELNANRGPVLCPPSGDVRDAVLPGLGDRLRRIREAGSAGVDPVPSAIDSTGRVERPPN